MTHINNFYVVYLITGGSPLLKGTTGEKKKTTSSCHLWQSCVKHQPEALFCNMRKVPDIADGARICLEQFSSSFWHIERAAFPLSFQGPVLLVILCCPHCKPVSDSLLTETTTAMANLGFFPLPSVQVLTVKKVSHRGDLVVSLTQSEVTLPNPGAHGFHCTLNPSDYCFMNTFSLIRSLFDFPKPWFFTYPLRIPSGSLNQTTNLPPSPGFPQSYPRSCYYK